ncbi:hypothetical protein DFH07DRAFT_981820 [Mycena maculata]|uniref:DUF6535 domain-containing protein n=1 Tax=Mycena maculata TaxID=230809 RepID=A0AAD7IEZ9_9AGAR|nr:hypothetical protein DFH07DRAFT_981820 [Mycena maculata]
MSDTALSPSPRPPSAMLSDNADESQAQRAPLSDSHRPHCETGGYITVMRPRRVLGNIPKIQKAIEATKPQAPTMDKKTTLWNAYMKLADEYDKDFQQKYSTDLDTGLIFAGLFSAVTSDPNSTSTVTQSPDPDSEQRSCLSFFWPPCLPSNGSCTTTQLVAEEPSKSAASNASANSTVCAKWKFDTVLQMFPLISQLALFLFSSVLSLYWSPICCPIALIVLAMTSFGLATCIFLLGSAILSPDSPFQTPFAPFLVQLVPTTYDSQRC